MAVKAIEAPSAPVQLMQEGDKPPPPIFKDDLLTVYAIPIYPSPPEADGQLSDMAAELTPGSVDRTLKRKRTPSPSASAKRRAPPVTDHTIDTASPVPRTLVSRARSPQFDTRSLSREDAQEWRKLMLQDMFPMQEPALLDPALSKKEKARLAQVQGKKVTIAHDSEGAPSQPRMPAQSVPQEARLRRLPPLAEGDASVPSVLPTLAYLLVGPSVRGKFDVKKAEALGLPRGPIRSRLAAGETVSFEVDDGQGGKTMRSVRPEECVGPSEMAQVSHIKRTLQVFLPLEMNTMLVSPHSGCADPSAYTFPGGFVRGFAVLFAISHEV